MLDVFWWATYKRQKAGIKLHTLYDVKTQIPDFVIVTPASVNDINGMDFINYQHCLVTIIAKALKTERTIY